MLGRKEWFRIRKYGGWGIVPQTWQGWVYVAALILPVAIINALPEFDEQSKRMFTSIWLTAVMIDVADIMIRMKKDERETIHEALAERNASWWIVGVLVAAMIYQLITSGSRGMPTIDPVILVALFGGAAVKTLTHWYLRDK